MEDVDDYTWYNMVHNLGNIKIKGRKGNKYLCVELNVPIDPFLQGEADIDKITGRLIWGVKKEAEETDDE
jgi:hypothetical protein